ncbi:MAG: threonine/serine dehydratase [Candidatus Dormibacteria bacterium]|jgi:threonine dehydratase
MDTDAFLTDHAAAIRAAASRIAGHVRHTPLLDATDVGPAGEAVLLKPELLQPTGSFKVRGAFNAALALLERSPDSPGLITVSSGNHGQAVALAAARLGLRCIVVMPQGSNPVKVAAVAALGAEVVSEGVTGENREQRVLEVMAGTGLDLIHPFDAWDTIHGQGTIGLEVLADCADLGMLVTPVGGGGLISGCAIAVKAARPAVRVVGVEPELAADAAASRRTGQRQHLEHAPATLADGLRSLAIGERGFEVIVERGQVDDIVTVSEAEIESAVLAAWTRLHLVVEPSGAVPLAALLAGRLPATAAGPRAVLVLSGGNVDPSLAVRLLGRPG